MEHNALLERFRPELKRLIDIRYTDLWDQLVSQGVVSQLVMEKIQADFKSNGEQVGEFLGYLGRRPFRDYLAFRQTLIATGQGHVVTSLLPEDGKIRGVNTRGQSADDNDVQESIKARDEEIEALRRELAELKSSAQTPPPPSVDEIRELKKELEALKLQQSQTEKSGSVSGQKEEVNKTTEGKLEPPTRTGQEVATEDDKAEVLFTSSGWLKVRSKDIDQPIKQVVSADQLWTVTDSTTPAEVDAIYVKMVNIGPCCDELFQYARMCVQCAVLLIYDVKDNTPSNTDIVSGLELAIPNLKQLRKIEIKNTYIGLGGKQVLRSLPSNLRLLLLSNTKLRGCGSELAAGLAGLPLLVYFDLAGTSLTGEEMAVVLDNLIANCSHMVALLIGNNNLSRATAQLIRAQEAFKLKAFSMYGGKLGSNSLISVVKSTPLNLEYLTLDRNLPCKDIEKELISAIEERSKLWYLTLGKNQVSKDAWRKIESLIHSRGGCFHERLKGTEESKRGMAFMDKIIEAETKKE